MKKIVGLIVCAVAFSGCFTSNVLVTIRPDGSGTVEQTTTIRPADILKFQKLASPDTPANLLDPTAFRDLRRDFEKSVQGMGVATNFRLRSSRPLETADTIGWQLIYDFSDMGALSLDLLPQIPGARGFIAAKGDTISTRIQVTLEPIAGGLERYTFRFPRFDMDPSAEPPASWAAGSPDEMATLKKLMEGSRITLAVKSAAPIVRTNSPFRQENRVTLLDADIGQAMFSKQIGTLATSPSTFDQFLTEFADLPGVTLAKEREITIDVQNPSTDLSAQPPPAVAPSTQNTEIYLAPLSSSDGKVTVGPPVNISNNPGYDNQPAFTSDGSQILFASSRGPVAPARDGRGTAASIPPTDIYRYSIALHSTWRVTNTPEGEFSPVMMADGKNISVVRVEADGTQRLWQVGNSDNASGAWSVILPDIRPVGYYAWMDDRTVAVFVLGQNNQPSTLQLADTQTGKAPVIASDIGRSIQRMPSGAVSFVHRERASTDPAATNLTLKRLIRNATSAAPQIETLIATPAGVVEPFVAWMPDGSALVAVNSTLFQWREGAPGWTAVANLGAFGLRDVTRLAVSPKGDRIAVVALPK